MLFFLFNLLSILILLIDANWNVISRSPNQMMSINTHEFRMEIDQMTNQPNFPSLIRIHQNATTIPFQIDVSINNSAVIYSTKTLSFHTPDNLTWNANSEYYITFDEGVLYSNNISKSTAQQSSDFWTLVTMNPISTTTIYPNTNTKIYPIGESSPPYSTRLGIGLGITLILVLFLIEILYFIYCDRGRNQRENYSP